MQKIIPVLTEKSLSEAQSGKYSFWVDRGLSKDKIKVIIYELFGVNVVRVRTVNVSGQIKKNYRGRKRIIQPRKKAIVTLREKEKIDLFEESKK